MDCSSFKPTKKSRCSACGRTWDKHSLKAQGFPEAAKELPCITQSIPSLKLSEIPETTKLKRTELILKLEEPIGSENPQDSRITASNIRASNEILLNEILNLVFPNGKDATSVEELNLRLYLVVGVLKKYGFGPQTTQK